MTGQAISADAGKLLLGPPANRRLKLQWEKQR